VEVLEAIRNGHLFCALDSLNPANGFAMRVSSDGASGGPGDQLEWSNNGRIHVEVPSGAGSPLIRIIHNGRELVAREGSSLDEPGAGPGTYRVEVFLRQPGITGWGRQTLWIFSNPTYLRLPSRSTFDTTMRLHAR
jgi:hypothetical protein